MQVFKCLTRKLNFLTAESHETEQLAVFSPHQEKIQLKRKRNKVSNIIAQ